MKKNISFVIDIILAAALSAGAVLIPYASLIITAVSAVFFAVKCYRLSAVKSAVLTVVALAVIYAAKAQGVISLETAVMAASVFCLSSLNGAVIGRLIKGNAQFHMVLTGGTLATLTSFLAEFGFLKFYRGMNLGEELINKPISEFFGIYTEVLSKSGVENSDAILDAMGDVQWAMQQMLAAITPSMIIIFCAAYAYIIFLIARKILFTKSGIILPYPHFHQLHLPKAMAAVLGVLFLLTFFMGASSLSGAITNIVIILSAVYCVCGLSVIDFFFKERSRVHWALRAVIYISGYTVLSVIGAILPFANITTILLFLGVIDGVADFRHRRQNP